MRNTNDSSKGKVAPRLDLYCAQCGAWVSWLIDAEGQDYGGCPRCHSLTLTIDPSVTAQEGDEDTNLPRRHAGKGDG